MAARQQKIRNDVAELSRNLSSSSMCQTFSSVSWKNQKLSLKLDNNKTKTNRNSTYDFSATKNNDTRYDITCPKARFAVVLLLVLVENAAYFRTLTKIALSKSHSAMYNMAYSSCFVSCDFVDGYSSE